MPSKSQGSLLLGGGGEWGHRAVRPARAIPQVSERQAVTDSDAQQRRERPARKDQEAESRMLQRSVRHIGRKAATELHERPGTVWHQFAVLRQPTSSGQINKE